MSSPAALNVHRKSAPSSASSAQAPESPNSEYLPSQEDADASLRRMHAAIAANRIRAIAARKAKLPIVLFFGRDTFSDNSKYLFLAAISQTPATLGFVPVWCSYNQRLVAQLSRRGMHAHWMGEGERQNLALFLKAATAVFCTNVQDALRSETSQAALSGAGILQLWHGVGSKRLDLMRTDEMNLLDPRILTSLAGAAAVDIVLSPSSGYDSLWREAFGVDRVVRAGLPRNAVLDAGPEPGKRSLQQAAPEWIDAYALPENSDPKCVYILFAPTFTLAQAEPVWADEPTIKHIRRGAQAAGCGEVQILIKPHPFDTRLMGAMNAPTGATLIPPALDIYPTLNRFYLLITDKSSLSTDFLLTGKPIVFFNPAHEDERQDHPLRGLQTGAIATTKVELEHAVTASLAEDEFSAQRTVARERVFPTPVQEACPSLLRLLQGMVAERCHATNHVEVLEL